jgi:hypothetical protein
MEENARQSPLLCLPAEIRNKIFNYALRGHRIRPVVERSVILQGHPDTWARLRRNPIKHRFALPKVCRQIYNETAILPYTLSTFSLIYITDFERWLFESPDWEEWRIQYVRSVRFGTWGGKRNLERGEWDLVDHLSAHSLEHVHVCLRNFAVINGIDQRRVDIEEHFAASKLTFSFSESYDWLDEVEQC